jgi:hypothetical protein
MVRILPMDKKIEFGGQSIEEVQNSFFLSELPNRENQSGIYYFKTSGLKANLGETLVLFQYDNKIIACATLYDMIKFDEPKREFKGGLFFTPSTIKTFQPLTHEELSEIFCKPIKFNQIKQFLDPSYIDDFFNSLISEISAAV